MNKDETEQAAAVMMAFSAGQQIDSRFCFKAGLAWQLDLAPNWNWAIKEFRLRPKPREWWVNVYANDQLAIHCSRDDANEIASLTRIECVRVTEVIE